MGSVVEIDEETFFGGVRVVSREDTTEDDRDYVEYDSGADYQNDNDSWDTKSYSALSLDQRAQGC